ncbi:MAG: tRNA uridine-5-carboxymethylaminomethyl(34) synthesis enzyme MnmG [Phycisphaerales bacterium]|nr:tRNA uridine-5-carboxymethylaminomethyl(34) synthesis enzyme MnmG [Phycisphaerae bacterium]NNM27696.1 tRNA uridine-5-carboxymethylaminomethyl(34) synthesis enzyme MnmG [Phycisphaerales bacterium]
MHPHYHVIVIGGGHAGTEAAWAAASALGEGGRVALVTMDPARIGQMSCNPAIGGLAKGQMVREVDALGGIMGRAIDATGIMFKMLNTSKGAAVRGPRAQADKYAYAAEVQRLIATRSQIHVIAAAVDDIVVEGGRVTGVRLPVGAGRVTADDAAIEGNAHANLLARPVFPSTPPVSGRLNAPRQLRGDAVVLTTGTFMRGLMHTGDERTEGGRVDEDAAVGISGVLRRLGFELGRLKTGTPPRLHRASLDWDDLETQVGDDTPVAFSDLSPAVLPQGRFPHLPQTGCRITRTTAAAHDLIRANLHRAPMYSGQIEAATGPRYCPSIEDKVIRFADRDSHHVFLEPESLFTDEIYCNGISTSLPRDVQEAIVHAMPGCANAEILRWGYAVEYDMVWPHQIDATTMTKLVAGLFLAGQINCTTGYEEAAGQGVIAGLNAARLARVEPLERLGRSDGFIGVMMDDLVTKTPREPYRMFTSRAEHRLLLRADNADTRLTPWGRSRGLIDDERWRAYETRAATLDAIRHAFEAVRVGHRTLREHARRPDVTTVEIATHLNGHGPDHAAADGTLLDRVVTEARYDGYISRQRSQVRRQQAADGRVIPGDLDYEAIPGLRAEARETLARFRPTTLGQAGRLPGVNPADVTILAVTLHRRQADLRPHEPATSPGPTPSTG